MDFLAEIPTIALIVAAAVGLIVLTFRLARRDKKTVNKVGNDTAGMWMGDSFSAGGHASSDHSSDSGGGDGGGGGD